MQRKRRGVGDGRVSIRSRRLSAGECSEILYKISKYKFQSAPADCRRENYVRPVLGTSIRGFNPLPPTVGGRMIEALRGQAHRDVSIRSRRLSAGESCGAVRSPRSFRFNPLPPTVGGRMRTADPHGVPRNVSIRSRRLSAGEWSHSHATCSDAGSFNPLPPTVGGRMSGSVSGSSAMQFQSAPADCRRENADFLNRILDEVWFQSAPADCRRENFRHRAGHTSAP